MKVGIQKNHDDLGGKSLASSLAEQISLPLVTSNNNDDFDYILYFDEETLTLRKTGNSKISPFCLDFTKGETLFRQKTSGKKSLLARAVGCKGESLRLVDATAGFGKDALVLAKNGCQVFAIERSPVIFALLQDALLRAQKRLPKQTYLQTNLEIGLGDARALIPKSSPDVVYLDPMYPESRKAAAPKKHVQVLRDLLGQDEDAAELFEIAFENAKRRVVVKRPIQGTLLAPNPSHTLKGKMARFDIYLK